MRIEGPSDVSQTGWDRLTAAAIDVRQRAYAPYSGYRVGAALLAGPADAAEIYAEIYVGCNVENASFGATLCAERLAGGSAIAAGARRWQAMVVATAEGAMPCGICRQWLVEFAPPMPLVLIRADSGAVVARTTAEALLPAHFRLDRP